MKYSRELVVYKTGLSLKVNEYEVPSRFLCETAQTDEYLYKDLAACLKLFLLRAVYEPANTTFSPS